MARKFTRGSCFFLEWLILDKNMTEEKFKKLSMEEKDKLNDEYIQFKNKSLIIGKLKGAYYG